MRLPARRYLNFAEALACGSLSSKIREQIALAVAEGNMCTYCLSAHTFIGGKVGLTEKDNADARPARAAAQKTDAILKLARSLVVQRGEVNDAERVELGSLKGNEGDQNYDIPKDTDLSKFRTVVIYCQRFNATFGAAPLEKF